MRPHSGEGRGFLLSRLLSVRDLGHLPCVQGTFAIESLQHPRGHLCYPFVADKGLGPRGKYSPKAIELEALDQHLTNDGQQANSSLWRVFLNKVLLVHGYTHSFTLSGAGLALQGHAEHFQQRLYGLRSLNVYHVALYRKRAPTPALDVLARNNLFNETNTPRPQFFNY